MKTIKWTLLSLVCVAFLASCGGKDTEKKTDATKTTFEDFYKGFFNKYAKKGKAEELQSIIHPEKGIFFVVKPGVAPIIRNFKTIAEVSETFPDIKDKLKGIKCKKLKREALPKFDPNEGFDKEGCYYQEVSDSKDLQNYIEVMKTDNPDVVDEKSVELAKYFDSVTNRKVVLTEQEIDLHFAEIDGKWYLVAINKAIYDEGA